MISKYYAKHSCEFSLRYWVVLSSALHHLNARRTNDDAAVTRLGVGMSSSAASSVEYIFIAVDDDNDWLHWRCRLARVDINEILFSIDVSFTFEAGFVRPCSMIFMMIIIAIFRAVASNILARYQ